MSSPILRSEKPVSGGGTSPRSVTWITPPPENDLILLAVTLADNVVPTVPDEFRLGWKEGEFSQVDGVLTNLRIYWKLASDSEPTTYDVTFTGGGQGNIGMVSVQGSPYAYFHGIETRTSDTASTTKTWDGVVTSVEDTLHLLFGAFTDADSTPDVNCMEYWDSPGTDCRLYLMGKDVPATGSTGNINATGSSVSRRRTVTINIYNTLGKPLTTPFVGKWITDATIYEAVGYQTEISHTYLAEQTNGEPGIGEDGGSIMIFPPPDTIRMTCKGRYRTFTQTNPGLSSAGCSGSLGQSGTITRVSDFVFVSPGNDGATSQDFDVEWTQVGAGDWDRNSQSSVNTPPTSPSTGCREHAFCVASAVGDPSHAIATEFVNLKVYELEFRDGLILTSPTVPQNLIVSFIDEVSMSLAWTNPIFDVDGIEIERSLTGVGAWSLIATVTDEDIEYTDIGLDPNTTYYYRLKYVNQLGYSDIDSDTTDIFILTAEALGATQIFLNWDNVTFDTLGSSIERSLTGIGSWVEIDTVPSGTSFYSDEGLAPETLYYYRVRDISEDVYTIIASAETTGISDIRVGDGHDANILDMDKLVPQPSMTGIKITRRSIGHGHQLQDDFLYAELEYNVSTRTVYRSILTQLGILSAFENEITITLKKNLKDWTKFNATAVKPQMGEDIRESNFFPRNIRIPILFLEEIEL